MIKEKWIGNSVGESGHSRFRNGEEYISVNSTPFPVERDKQVEALASAFENTVRAATLLFFRREVGAVIYKSQYVEKFGEIFGGTKIGEIHKKSAYEYPDQLLKQGLLNKVLLKTKNGNINHVGWALTEMGLKFQTIAAFFIQFEQEHTYSLYPVLGGIAIPRKEANRAPLTRMKILLELEKGNRSITEIGKNLGIYPNTVKLATEALLQAGMLDHTSVNVRTHENLPKFRFVNQDNIPTKYLNDSQSLQAKIAKACTSDLIKKIEFTVDDIIDILNNDTNFDASSMPNSTNLRKSIYMHLTLLSNRGAITRTNPEISRHHFSSAKLSPKGEEFLKDFIHPLFDAITDDGSFNKMQNHYLIRVRDSLKKIGNDIGKRYAPYSFAEKKSGILDIRITEVIQSLGEKGVTMIELQRTLGLSASACRNHLKHLLERELVEITLQKGIQHYRLKASVSTDLPPV